MRKSRLHVGLLVLALTLGLAGTAAADYTWYSYGGHEYAVTQTWGYWTTCEAEAVALGYHLVTINSAPEQTWIISNFPTLSSWTGFERLQGNWGWSSGETVTFTNWRGGFPLGEPDLNYAVMISAYGDIWVNAHDDVTYYGIIERSAPVPLPSALMLLGSGLAGLAAWRRRRG